MTAAVRILYLEDNKADFELARMALTEDNSNCTVAWVEAKSCLFKSIVEASQEAIAISDPARRLVYINPAHERLFGRSLEEAQRLSCRDYYTQESLEVLDNIVAPALARGDSWEGELEAVDAKGRRFMLWERADSVRDADGKMLYGFGLMHDITERKHHETALVRTRQQLRALSRRLIEAQETEQHRLARELHDEVGQSLTAAKLDLFDVDHARSHAERGSSLGLIGIEERVALVNGSVEIRSVPNQGAQVHAVFPLLYARQSIEPEPGQYI